MFLYPLSLPTNKTCFPIKKNYGAFRLWKKFQTSANCPYEAYFPELFLNVEAPKLFLYEEDLWALFKVYFAMSSSSTNKTCFSFRKTLELFAFEKDFWAFPSMKRHLRAVSLKHISNISIIKQASAIFLPRIHLSRFLLLCRKDLKIFSMRNTF